MALRTWTKNLLVYDPTDFMIRRGAESFALDSPAFNSKEGVKDFNGVLTGINNYCHVELLIFETHGAPGYVHFPGGGS